MTETPGIETTPMPARPCECDNAQRLASAWSQDEAHDRALDAAAKAHARTQYRHASSLDDLTEQDWRAMRAFVAPLVEAALEAVKEPTP